MVLSDRSGNHEESNLEVSSSDDLNKDDRTSGRNTILRIIKIGLVVLVVGLILAIMATAVMYDHNERWENNHEQPAVMSVVAVDEDSTLVFYQDAIPDRMYDAYCVIDKKGRYERPPESLREAIGDPVDLYIVPGPNLQERRIFNTGDGVTTVYRSQQDNRSQSIRSSHLDAEYGTFDEPVTIIDNVSLDIYMFDAISSGSNIHVLVSNTSETSGQGDVMSVYYINSDDGGRTWNQRQLILSSPRRASYGHIFAQGDQVRILLIRDTDSTYPLPATNDMMFVSEDGGSTWDEPKVCTMGPLTRGRSLIYGTIDRDGNLFMFGQIDPNVHYQNPSLTFLYSISIDGMISRIGPIGDLLYIDLWGDYERSVTAPLFFHDETTDDQVMFLYSRRRPATNYLVRMDGSVAMSHVLPDKDRDTGISIPMKYENGWIYGIGLKRYTSTATGGCESWHNYEMRLQRMNVKTGGIEVLGKPYEVVQGHTDSEDEAYQVSMQVFSLLLIFSFLALLGIVTVLDNKKGSSSEPTRDYIEKSN